MITCRTPAQSSQADGNALCFAQSQRLGDKKQSSAAFSLPSPAKPALQGSLSTAAWQGIKESASSSSFAKLLAGKDGKVSKTRLRHRYNRKDGPVSEHSAGMWEAILALMLYHRASCVPHLPGPGSLQVHKALG